MPKLTVSQKLVELHEKLAAIDSERDKLKSKLERQSTWWKNPAMLTAITGLLAILGTSVDNCRDRYKQATDRDQVSSVEKITHRAAYRFVVDRQNELESMCSAYSQIIVSVLTPAQRRQVSSQIKARELPALEERAASPKVDESANEGDSTQQVEAPASIYDMIQRQVKDSGSVDLNQIEKSFVYKK